MKIGSIKTEDAVITYLRDKISLISDSIGVSCPFDNDQVKNCHLKSKDGKMNFVNDSCKCQAKFISRMPFLKANIEMNVLDYVTENRPEEVKAYEFDPVESKISTGLINMYETKIEPYLDELNGKVLQNGLSLFFSGPNSTGKTFMANYILSVAISEGLSGFYITFKDLYYLYNSTIIKNNDDIRYNPLEVYNYVANCQMLVLDEMGKETLSESALTFLEQLIKHRTSRNLATVIVSNLNIVGKYDTTMGMTDKSEFLKRYGNSIGECLKVNYFFFVFSKEAEANMRNKSRKSWL